MSEVISVKFTDAQTMAVIDACKTRAEKIAASPDMDIPELEKLGDLTDALIAIECAVITADKGENVTLPF